jgi:copper resistance protein C
MYSRFSIALSLIGLLCFGWTGRFAWAHAYPVASSPANGAVLKEPPKEVRIQFTEGLEIAFSKVTVKGPSGELVNQGKLRQLAEDTLATNLKPLAPGNYSVEWQVLSVDTHITEGILRFTVGVGGK